MADITLLPSAKVPLVYEGDSTMTTQWYRFFWNVYGFTGDSSGAVPVSKGGTGLTSIGNHQLIIGNSAGVFERTELIGSGITITYAPGTTTLAIGNSGVTPGTYGSASKVGQFTVDIHGTLIFAQDVTIGIDATQIISGTIASARISGSYTGITGVGTLTTGTWNANTIGTAYGGTGLTSFTSGGALYATSSSVLTSGTLPVTAGGTGQSSFTNGQLLIGNTTGNTLDKATLTAGTAIGITNGAGAITITNTLPDQTVVLSNGTGISVTGTYPNFTITNTAPSSGGTVTSVSGTAPISVATGTTTPVISISQATTSTNGYLSSTDWNTFNSKQPAGTYVTSISIASSNGFTGTSSGGATPSLTLATSVTGILKGNGTAISAATSGTDYAPATSGTSILYGNGAGGFSNVTIGTGVSFAGGTLSATGSGGTVTSVAALTLGTTGTDLSSTVANGTTTPVITLNVPTASAANRGALSSTDWSTFNGKQAALVSGTNIKTVGGVSLLGSGDVGTIGTGYGGTGLSTFTANRIFYASSTSVMAQSAGLTFDGSNFATTGNINGVNITASGSLLWGSSGTYAAGCIYADANWGAIFRAKTASPAQAIFRFANSADVEAMRVTTGNSLQVVNSVSVGNAAPSTSGAGITFPATQSASTNANTLDDYEEGTWSGELRGSTARATTPVTATGNYTKIGNQVSIDILFFNVDTTGATGDMQVTGLPFVPAGGSTTRRYTGAVQSYGLSIPGLYNCADGIGGFATVQFQSFTNNGAWSNVQITAGATKFLMFSLTYQV